MTPLWIPAKWYTPTKGRSISLIVLHRQENSVEVGIAEAVAHYFQNLPASNKASAHRCYDPGTVVECVHEQDVAYHAPGANHNGIGLELPGKSTNDDWDTPPMEAALSLCAEDTTMFCNKYRIPLVFLDWKALSAGNQHGITTHLEVSKAFRLSDHTDPGAYFPMGRFLELCGSQPEAHLTPPVATTRFTGGDMDLVASAGVGFITAADAQLGTQGFYVLTADGGIRADGGASLPSTGAFNYLMLPVAERQGDRHFITITPNEDASPGFTLWSNDGGRYALGPGKEGWPA